MDKKEKNSQERNSCGFVLPLWERIFSVLACISIFYLIKKLRKEKVTPKFVEGWVVFNLLFSFISSLFAYNIQNKPLSWILVSYALLRVFEVIVYQINVILFEPYRKWRSNDPYKVQSATRMIILLIHNYIELIFWFSTIYIGLHIISDMSLTIKWIEFVKVSVFCFINSDLAFFSEYGLAQAIIIFAYIELISGLIMTLISLARFIGLLPAVEFEQQI